MDELNDHKDDLTGSSALTDTHSPAPKSPSEDLMGLEFDTTPITTPTATTPPPVTATVGAGTDTDEQETDFITTSIEGDGDNGFGDFGTVVAATPVAATATGNEYDGDDGFGDFGNAAPQDAFGATSTSAVGAGDEDDDDDGFGDFGAAPTAVGGDPFAGAADDDGFGDFGQVQAAGDGGDDDFGDFNDFGDEGFQNSDDFGDFGGSGDFGASGDANGDDDPFGASPSEPVQLEVSAPAPQEPATPVETAPDFNAVNSRQVENYVLDKLSALYPFDESVAEVGGLLNTDLDSLDVTSILSDQELWTSLCESSFQGGHQYSSSNRSSVQSKSTLSAVESSSAAPQFQWKHSTLRKEYYASLGLAVTKEQNPASAPSSSVLHSATTPSASRSKVSSPLIMGTEAVSERKPLDLAATVAYCQFTRESLGAYSGEEMKDIVARLTDLTRQASDELTYWLDQREQMIMDNERYNEMIASLVGRAAKLKDAESKQKTNNKRGITRNSFHLK
ncbi:hypothetical protein EC957_012233 [Mortierella hygrophila]|uniref:Uncharacterized protein n=1 Tax=Mortierella hygrophila TaxID=979708 RepID=A0A9P6K2U4_9FUNG|nr:hypothetical protein EC957_012233 [Mortierella hygrophila]